MILPKGNAKHYRKHFVDATRFIFIYLIPTTDII